MAFRLTRIFNTLAPLLTTASLLTAFSSDALAQSTSTAREHLIPVVVQEPSSQEFQQDRDALRAVGEKGDLSAFVATMNQLKEKWLSKDKLSYYCILSSVCGDLTSYDFGVSKLSEQEKDKEEYVMEALNHDDVMPLGMKAYFVGQLIYIPNHGLAGVVGQKWSSLRAERTELLLSTWQQLRGRTIPNFSVVPIPPKLPPLQYIYRDSVVNGNVDPNYITDAGERAKFIAATEKYRRDRQLVLDQEDVNRVISAFVPRAEEYIIAFYSSPPDKIQELKKYLAQYLSKSPLDLKASDEILASVKQNIQRDVGSSK